MTEDATTRFPAPAAPGGTSGAVQCAGCPEASQPRRKWQTFCSDRCRSSHHTRAARKRALEEAAQRMFEALQHIAAGDVTGDQAVAVAKAAIGDLKAP